jgi:hypothetical protein
MSVVENPREQLLSSVSSSAESECPWCLPARVRGDAGGARQRRSTRLRRLDPVCRAVGIAVRRRRLSVPVFLAAAALVLVPWIGWLASSLPCRYLARHWDIAWAGFDTALATTLALTWVAALRRAPWLDRAAVAAATLLAADAWFDVVTSRGATAVALATTEAVAVELPIALLCIWVAHRFATPAARDDKHTIATTNKQGALS